MNKPRVMQLLQVKMNGHLMEGGRLSDCADEFMRMVEEEAGFNSIYKDLAHGGDRFGIRYHWGWG
jgi:hypothetical protein